jgi:large subunit ribosomal protein L35
MSKAKLKTHRGAAKRFKVTGTGKIMRRKAGGNHILTKKNSRRKRALKKDALVAETEKKNIKQLIPYL